VSTITIGNKPFLIIIVGLIGTGKSTLAKALAEKLGCAVISSDIIRKQLANIPEMEQRYEGYNEGIYSSAFSEMVYSKLFMKATLAILGKCSSVILNASFGRKFYRFKAKSLAKREGTSFLAIECRLDEKILKERLANRKDTVSDGRWDIYLEQKKVFEPVVEIPPEEHIVVDTSKLMEEVVGEVLNRINGKRENKI